MKTQAHKYLEFITRNGMSDLTAGGNYIKQFAENWEANLSWFEFSDGSEIYWEFDQFVAKHSG